MKNPTLIYDIKSIPDSDFGLTAEQIFEIYQREKIVLYDSSSGGRTPIIIDTENSDIKMVDISSTQIDLTKLNKEDFIIGE